MQEIFAMGVTTQPLDALDLVTILRPVLPKDTKIEVVDNLEVCFGIDSDEHCWRFGGGCEETIGDWVDKMKEDDYIFEGATLIVDDLGRVAGVWPGKENPEPVEEKEKEDEGEDKEPEVKVVSPTEIVARVMLRCEDEEGHVTRLKVKGKYRRRRHEDGFSLVDIVDIDLEKDLDHEDLEKLLAWVNKCETNLLDYTITGPAYEANQDCVHNFSIRRIVLDNLHAAVLDRMISALKESRNSIQLPQSATEMRSDGK